jgi:hypothetical protein
MNIGQVICLRMAIEFHSGTLWHLSWIFASAVCGDDSCRAYPPSRVAGSTKNEMMSSGLPARRFLTAA